MDTPSKVNPTNSPDDSSQPIEEPTTVTSPIQVDSDWAAQLGADRSAACPEFPSELLNSEENPVTLLERGNDSHHEEEDDLSIARSTEQLRPNFGPIPATDLNSDPDATPRPTPVSEPLLTIPTKTLTSHFSLQTFPK